MEKVGEDSRGNELFVEDNEVGGRRYLSSEIGGGAVIWDTCIGSPEMMRLALKVEAARDEDEFRAWRLGMILAGRYIPPDLSE